MKQLVALKLAAALVIIGIGGVGLSGCSSKEEQPRGNERWVTTENTTIEIDWDKVNEAYKQAQGPEDLEKRINEIYQGEELISVSVRDDDAKTQVVTGFFDKNQSGAVDEGEKIFTIKRDLVDESKAQYQITGHGAYSYYHSPMWDIASGMLIGSMLSSMFMPNYVPVYTRPYVTSQARRAELQSYRSTYRATNPVQPKASGSGRTYGSQGSSWGSGSSSGSSSGSTPVRRSSGGSRFGVHRRRKDGAEPVRLTA